MVRINVDRLNQYVNSVGSSRLACRVSTNSRITVSISVRRFKWRGQWPELSTHSLSFVTIPSSSPVHFQVTLLMSICLNFIGEEAKKKKKKGLTVRTKTLFFISFYDLFHSEFLQHQSCLHGTSDDWERCAYHFQVLI